MNDYPPEIFCDICKREIDDSFPYHIIREKEVVDPKTLTSKKVEVKICFECYDNG